MNSVIRTYPLEGFVQKDRSEASPLVAVFDLRDHVSDRANDYWLIL